MYTKTFALDVPIKFEPKNSRFASTAFNSSDVQAKSYPHPWYKGEDHGTPHLSFLYVAVFRNDLTFCGKPLIFSTRWGVSYG